MTKQEIINETPEEMINKAIQYAEEQMSNSK